MNETKICEQCQREKDIECFYRRPQKHNPTTRVKICIACYKQNVADRKRQLEEHQRQWQEEQRLREQARAKVVQVACASCRKLVNLVYLPAKGVPSQIYCTDCREAQNAARRREFQTWVAEQKVPWWDDFSDKEFDDDAPLYYTYVIYTIEQGIFYVGIGDESRLRNTLTIPSRRKEPTPDCPGGMPSKFVEMEKRENAGQAIIVEPIFCSPDRALVEQCERDLIWCYGTCLTNVTYNGRMNANN